MRYYLLIPWHTFRYYLRWRQPKQLKRTIFRPNLGETNFKRRKNTHIQRNHHHKQAEHPQNAKNTPNPREPFPHHKHRKLLKKCPSGSAQLAGNDPHLAMALSVSIQERNEPNCLLARSEKPQERNNEGKCASETGDLTCEWEGCISWCRPRYCPPSQRGRPGSTGVDWWCRKEEGWFGGWSPALRPPALPCPAPVATSSLRRSDARERERKAEDDDQSEMGDWCTGPECWVWKWEMRLFIQEIITWPTNGPNCLPSSPSVRLFIIGLGLDFWP